MTYDDIRRYIGFRDQSKNMGENMNRVVGGGGASNWRVGCFRGG